MNLERFARLVSAYGANSKAWPIEEREDAMRFLQHNALAEKLLKDEQVLDEHLDFYLTSELDLERLKSNIVDAAYGRLEEAKTGPLSRLLDWLIPVSSIDIWRPALAATLPLIIGTLLGMNIDAELDPGDSWEDGLEIMAMADVATTGLDPELSPLEFPDE